MFGITFALDLFRNQRRQRKPVRLLPAVERLESRLVLSTFNEFPVPGAPDPSAGAHITTDPDGNLWFTHNGNRAVGRITSEGSVTEFSLPSDIDDQFGIASGPDGNLWVGIDRFSPSFPNNQMFILRMTPDGIQTYFRARLDNGGAESNDFLASFYGPTVGPDGNLWYHAGLYSSPNEDLLGRITPGGTVSNFILGTPSQGIDGFLSAGGITLGPDGDLWLRIGDGLHGSPPAVRRITPDGQLSDVIAATHALGEITTGPDGNLWGVSGNLLERITLGGSVTDFSLSNRTRACGITAGPDGNVWFTEPDANQIGVITPDGQITEYKVPTPNSKPAGITAGLDGNIWFTELGSGQIGEFVLNDGGGAGGPAAAGRLTGATHTAGLPAVEALFASAAQELLSPAAVNQQFPVAAVVAVFSSRQSEVITPRSEQAMGDADTVSHQHKGDQAVAVDVVGLADPLTEPL